MYFIADSKLVVDVVHPIEHLFDGPEKALMKGVLVGHLMREGWPVP
jgi:hypothetical protein